MEGQDGRKPSSDESGSDINPVGDTTQQNLLEEEIKKIISDLDLKFDESSQDEEEAGKTGHPSTPGVEHLTDRRARVETPHLRVDSASTASNATTVVHQRVPPKVSTTHVKSERYDWPPAQGNRLPEAQQGRHVDPHGYYGNPEQAFYQPERDEITEPTTSETLHSTTENTSTSYAQSSTQQQPSAPQQMGFMPSVPEDRPLRDFRGVPRAEIPLQQYQPHPYDTLPESNAPLPTYDAYDCRLPEESSRYMCPPNYNQVECGHQCYPQGYQDVSPHPCQMQEPYRMEENVNRYNNSHMSYSPIKEPEKPGRRSFTDYLVSKSRSLFNRRDDSDSGEVIPQLYKACVKNGTTPPRFTFKAVTGIQPSYLGESTAPHRVPSTTQQNPPAMPSYDQMNGARCQEPVNPCSYYADLGCGYVSQGSVPEKVDIYCFDQLNTGFFRTSDHPPPLFADIAVQRTEKYATVFWAEIYGVVNVGTAFFIALLLQTFKFILQGIIRPLMIGSVQILSDYFIKPFLTLLYNGFTQPISIFLYNVIASIRDVMQPLAKGLGYFFELIAVILRAIRLVEVRNVTNITPCSPQAVKYC